jgi:hypothetical protein
VAQVVLGQQGDLPDVAKQFPPGKDSGTEILNITIANGPYEVRIESNPAFQPNRTIYIPLNVSSSVSVPILSGAMACVSKPGKCTSNFTRRLQATGTW